MRHLTDYINPILRKTPNILIIHGGTNDITNDVDTGKNYDKIISTIKKKHPKTKIVISNVICRFDKKEMTSKVRDLNERLKKIAEAHKIDMIDNSNISEKNLSNGKLHLNNGGSSILATNYIRYLNNPGNSNL